MSETSVIETMVRENPVASLRAVVAGLSGLDAGNSCEADLIDVIGELETLKCVAESAQATATRGVYAAAVARQEAAGMRGSRVGRGIGHQIALARREPPSRGSAHLGLAREVAALPHLAGLWRQGRITERRVSLILGRIVWLDLDDRRGVDAQLAGDPDRAERLCQMNDWQARGAADALACAADPAGAVRRRAAAEADRHVSSRPAPDTMLRLSALLPVKEGVAVIAALTLAADQARAAGDERSRGQVMADTLVGRVTGRDPVTEPVPVHVDVTVPLDALLPEGSHTGQQPHAFGWVDGYGEVPADLARSLTADAVETLGVFRRLFTDPTTGQLVAMESAARCFPLLLALFLRRRDRYCRNPWCGAPIRHTDHAVSVEEGGPTSADNGQGLCEACNYAKQAPGWRSKTRIDPDGTHVVETTTPTGHVHETRPPPAHPRRE
ncbi:HNH endonuclease [uncultured Nocardioides sp.]|uniref:HNH endonuclease n=1 Tax=uncultured Nocardioides sp. TaxID=198441 RepID=UPI002614F37B|nr:HNH endonuclease [uncultured Nocardioides sp.]